ncbi:MAG: DUF1576 domain-containing protein [Pseudoflavonifractor sp.]|nr:DUF1576 domain-containing protein [Pseudoflavonifractor sp.]
MRYEKIYPAAICYCVALVFLAFVLDTPAHIWEGFQKIIFMEDSLITDYMELAGIGAAFINSALVLLSTLFVFWLVKDPLNGYTIVTLGLMGGFSLFGKNIFNIWPIILGSFLYARFRREPFVKYSNVSLLATSLSPVVSFVCFSGGWVGFLVGIMLGICIGFLLPSLSAYTYRIQNGMNLYNMGFACGLVAMMLVPVMSSMGHAPTTAYYWAKGYNVTLGIFMVLLCGAFILAGLFFCGRPPWAAWAGYRHLLKASGRAPSDFLRTYGAAPVLINMGIDGLIGVLYILLIGGDLNGPTLGGIFTIIGFSAYGKHCRNITPVMLGVIIGGLTMQWNLNDSAVQLAGLFCTTLAPIAGYFGWPFGVLAGFLHSSVVLHAGTAVEGINLYNNGYSGGLIAIVLYPTITAIIRHRRPVIQDEDYFDTFEHDEPITPATSSKK